VHPGPNAAGNFFKLIARIYVREASAEQKINWLSNRGIIAGKIIHAFIMVMILAHLADKFPNYDI
jgi:hypothetical protein